MVNLHSKEPFTLYYIIYFSPKWSMFSHPVQETLTVVNLEALPDKGERLRTQVKELEDALESLSLTASTEPG